MISAVSDLIFNAIKMYTTSVVSDLICEHCEPGIVFFRKLQSDAFVRLQTYLPLVLVIFFNCLESYESIALKLAEDDYAWFPHVYSE